MPAAAREGERDDEEQEDQGEPRRRYASAVEHARIYGARHSSVSGAHVRGLGPPGVRTLVQARFARIASVTEARLEDAGSGLAPATEGWFVVEQGEPA